VSLGVVKLHVHDYGEFVIVGFASCLLLELYRIADFTIQPNKNNSFYYSAEYE